MMCISGSNCLVISAADPHDNSTDPRKTSWAAVLFAIALAGMVFFGISNTARAQASAHFSGIQSTMPATGLKTPYGIAIDATGNIYIADAGNNRVLKETVSGGTYTQSVVPTSSLSFPSGVAVDAGGNVYIADSVNNRLLKETLSGNSYTESVIGSGLAEPIWVAVDGNGNVYASGTGNNENLDDNPVWKETLSNGTYTQSMIVNLASPLGLAVDANGDVFIIDYSNDRILKEAPSGGAYTQTVVPTSGIAYFGGIAADASGNVYVLYSQLNGLNGTLVKETLSGGSYVQTLFAGGFTNPMGVAVDGNGQVYVADSGTSRVLKVAASGNFGKVNVGTPSPAITLVFTFDSSGTISAPEVLTQGSTGLDFIDAGTGTCTTNGSTYNYTVGGSCTVDVVFTPRASGARYGAAVLKDGAGNLLATGYMQGLGVGPQVNFLPGNESMVKSSALNQPGSVAVDAVGNLYISDPSQNRVLKETASAGTYIESTVVSGSIANSIAIDGAGNLYLLGPSGAVKETATAGGYVQSTITSNNHAGGIAVDGTGSVYLTDDWYNTVLKETPSGSSYAEATIEPTGLTAPFGIAVDATGNLYIADPNNLRAVKETFSGGSYTQSILPTGGLTDHAYGIAADANGNVYISDAGMNVVVKETPSGSSYTQSTLQTSTLNFPAGVAIDSSGNVYVVDSWNNRVLKEDYADSPSLNFATTVYGVTSNDSPQIVTVANIGNAALSFPVFINANNPSISSSFTLDSSAASACPFVDAGSSTAGALASDASCTLSISFVPAAVGAISGTLVLTDDALNAITPTFATQPIQLTGTSTRANPSITWPTPGMLNYGTDLSGVLNATVSAGSTTVPGTFAYTATPSAGSPSTVTAATILGAGNYTLNVAFTPTDTAEYAGATGSMTLTVSTVTPIVTIESSANPQLLNQPVIFTAAVSNTVGMPTGTVTFFNGSTQLGQAALKNGVATYTMVMPAAGEAIQVMYAGDSNFTSAWSTTLPQGYSDFGITFGSSGSSLTVADGGQATYALVVSATGTGIAKLQAPVTLSVSGLPGGASASFSPATAPANAPSTNVTLTITTTALAAAVRPGSAPFDEKRPVMVLGLVLFFSLVRLRKASRMVRGKLVLVLFAFAGAATLIGISSCGSGGSSVTPAPPAKTNPQTYTLTVTGTEGPLSHTLTLTLNTY
jgi:sugar lactone lactonase YvrE